MGLISTIGRLFACLGKASGSLLHEFFIKELK